MPETHPPTRVTRKGEDDRERTTRERGVGEQTGDNPNTTSRGVGFAGEEKTPATEHESGRTDEEGGGQSA